jgi:glycosyltransferase involved in cell wall biosynthesis
MKKPKVLVVSSFHNPDKAVHAVDMWRSGRNIRELKKHVDWEITERPTIMKYIAKYKDEKDFTEEELEKTVNDLAQYDMVFGSYTAFMNNMVFALCKMVEDKYGTKFVLDVDDNLFKIKEDNIGWWLHMTHENTWDLQTIVSNATYLTTTNKHLADELAKRVKNPENIQVIPNYVSLDYKPQPDNHEGVVIGYFGGSSHYHDLHNTGVVNAVRRLMHEYRDIRFKSIGMPIEEYLPRKRYEYNGGVRGHEWVNKLWPSLNFDIALGPLTDDEFAKSKSNIKWQESAMMNAAFVGTEVAPYAETVRNGVDGYLVKNNEDEWYRVLKMLYEDKKLRQKIAKAANERVHKEFLIEDNWIKTKEALERFM